MQDSAQEQTGIFLASVIVI